MKANFFCERSEQALRRSYQNLARSANFLLVTNKNMNDFKIFTNTLNPKKFKHFSRGNKYSNSLLTKIRIGGSDLNQHKFTIGLIDSPECACHYKEESPKHYFIDCFLHTQERQQLFALIGHYIAKFKQTNKNEKLDIILYGLNSENDDYFHLNIILTKAVQNYILKTKRFETIL